MEEMTLGEMSLVALFKLYIKRAWFKYKVILRLIMSELVIINYISREIKIRKKR